MSHTSALRPSQVLSIGRWVTALAACLLGLSVFAQPSVTAQPLAGRARSSPNVAIIPISGPIDAVTSASVRRRLAEAERASADAVVIEIDSPGGEVGAVLEITNALKKTSVGRTVAWINPQAYSGGALIGLACGEILVTPGSSFGDAAPVTMGRNLAETERAKILSPLLTDVVGSARRNGYDEKLVQGMVTLGVELWLVENTGTGERLCIDRAEYRLLFGNDAPPLTGRPRVVGLPPVNGKVRTTDDTPSPATSPRPPQNPTDLQPASERISSRTAGEASMGLSTPTQRPTLTSADKGNWRMIEYVADGTSLFTFTDTDMKALGLAAATAPALDDVKQYLGATNLITLSPAWYESVARVLSSLWIKGVLVVLIIVGLAVEFIYPGLILPGTIAVFALGALVMPQIMMGLSGWWEVALILGGLALLAAEVFVLPGFGIAGGLGLVSLLAGLVLAFIPSAPTFPGMEPSNANLYWGLGFVVLGIATAGGVGYYMTRHLGTLPVFGKLVLSDRSSEQSNEEGTLQPMVGPGDPSEGIFPGAAGVTITPLRPSGKAEINGRVVDVVVEGPVLSQGTKVRVVSADAWRVLVEPA